MRECEVSVIKSEKEKKKDLTGWSRRRCRYMYCMKVSIRPINSG
jgi:hypothetical protein